MNSHKTSYIDKRILSMSDPELRFYLIYLKKMENSQYKYKASQHFFVPNKAYKQKF